MQSILQILKLNDPKTGVSSKTGRPYDMQSAECLLLTDTGAVDQVGVLDVPKHLRDKVTLGTFLGSFAMRANMASRKIEAVLVDLTPMPPQKPAAAPKPATVA